MGASGVSGPFRGAYNIFTFGTASVGANTGALGTIQQNMWSYTIPAGMDIVVVDAQIYCGAIGTNTRVNLLAGGASILSNTINSATTAGVGLASQGQTVGVGGGVTATISNGVFGTTATSIIAPVTPSAPVLRSQGAYIVAGATLAATVSNGANATNQITGTILWFPVSHPSLVRSAFE
jgi:hypothetical protein